MIPRFIERWALRKSLKDIYFFRDVVRRATYLLAGGDSERVHELTLETLVRNEDILEEVSKDFDIPGLHISLAGHDIMPFGTAAGLDKNGDALYPLSQVFGFLEPGTVVLHRRKGNDKPRVCVDNKNDVIYNAQGFPSKGLDYFLDRIKDYRARKGKAPIFISICGIPPEPKKLDVAYRELETIVKLLRSYSDGFVWNPYSPNTDALKALRTPQEFRRTAELIKENALGKLRLVKMGPFDNEPKMVGFWLELINSWLEGGGDGIVAVNTYPVNKDQVPSLNWGYGLAGKSGRFLQEYRNKAVFEARKNFPDSIIIATGGIDCEMQAFSAFQAGADALEGYTPYAFNGLGLLYEMINGVKRYIDAEGFTSLKEFQSQVRSEFELEKVKS